MESTTVPQMKRGRGRPRKNPEAEVPVVQSVTPVVAPKSNGSNGGGNGSVASAAAGEEAKPKRRGRPPKNREEQGATPGTIGVMEVRTGPAPETKPASTPSKNCEGDVTISVNRDYWRGVAKGRGLGWAEMKKQIQDALSKELEGKVIVTFTDADDECVIESVPDNSIASGVKRAVNRAVQSLN